MAWNFSARKGDSVREKYAELASYINGMKVNLGPDIVRASRTLSGSMAVSTRPRDHWPRPFLVTMTKGDAGNIYYKVAPGKINAKIPTIDGVEISGDPNTGKIPNGVLPATGTAIKGDYVVIEVTVDVKGLITKAEIKYTTTLGTNYYAGTVETKDSMGQIPIAFVKRNKVGAFTSFMQNTTHNMIYKVASEERNGKIAKRHFFYAV